MDTFFGCLHLYHSYLNKIVEEYINSGIFENKINTLNNLIYDYVENDKTAFYIIEEYEKGIENLLIFGEDRAKSISLQLEGKQPSEEYGDLTTNLDIDALGTIGGGGGKGFERNNNKPPNINNIDRNQIDTKKYTNIVIYSIILILSLIYVALYKTKKFRTFK